MSLPHKKPHRTKYHTDVQYTDPSDGEALVYSSSLGLYVPTAIATAADLTTHEGDGDAHHNRQHDVDSGSDHTGPTEQNWTPTLSATVANPTLGSGSVVNGEYWQIGKLIFCSVYIGFGTSAAAGSGVYGIDLPVTAAAPDWNNQPSIGSGRLYDDSGADTYLIDVRLVSNALVRPRWDQQVAVGNVSNSSPFTWSDNDLLTLWFWYIAA